MVTLTPLQLVYVAVLAIALALGGRFWIYRRNTRVLKSYMRVFTQVQRNCITAEPFFRYLCHLKAVMSTRSKDEVLHFETAPEKLLESYVKQQMRNADPEYKLFDERLSWQIKTFPPTAINLPATPWMNEFVMRFQVPQGGPVSVARVVSQLDEAIDCVRELPKDIQVVPGISSDGHVGVHLQDQPKAQSRREYVRGYLVLTLLWCLHSALLVTHGRTWQQVFGELDHLILAFGPPLAGYALLRVAFWIRPVTPRAKQPEGTLKYFLFHSFGEQRNRERKMGQVRVHAGR